MGKEEGQQSIEPGNITLAYPFSDGFKHTIWGNQWKDWASPTEKNEVRDLQVKALSVLWKIRSHPHYLEYPGSQGVKLSNILGELPTDPAIVSKLLNEKSATLHTFYSKSRMTQKQGDSNNPVPGELILVPEMDSIVKPGILTDVVVATGKKIAAEAIPNTYYDDPHRPVIELLAERAEMPVEEYKRFELARLNFNLFASGYIAHFIEEGTQAEQLLIGSAGSLKRTFVPVDDPATYLKENLGVEIKL
jgi:hypothetical protein